MLDAVIKFIIDPLSYIMPLTNQLHGWIYLILFALIFLETAFLAFSFLPGQSILFLTGAIAATAHSRLNIFLLLLTFIIASTIGAMIKYWYGINIESKGKIARQINDSSKMTQTQELFDENTKKSLLFSRFIPFVGLFVPLIAGTAHMDWHRFNKLNFVGVLLWVGICCFSGYFFGRTPFVRHNFSMIFLLLIIVPLIFEAIMRKLKEQTEKS